MWVYLRVRICVRLYICVWVKSGSICVGVFESGCICVCVYLCLGAFVCVCICMRDVMNIYTDKMKPCDVAVFHVTCRWVYTLSMCVCVLVKIRLFRLARVCVFVEKRMPVL